jgi:hypothetical protein
VRPNTGFNDNTPFSNTFNLVSIALFNVLCREDNPCLGSGQFWNIFLRKKSKIICLNVLP